MTKDKAQALIDWWNERATNCWRESKADRERGGLRWENYAGQAEGLESAARGLAEALAKSEPRAPLSRGTIVQWSGVGDPSARGVVRDSYAYGVHMKYLVEWSDGTRWQPAHNIKATP